MPEVAIPSALRMIFVREMPLAKVEQRLRHVRWFLLLWCDFLEFQVETCHVAIVLAVVIESLVHRLPHATPCIVTLDHLGHKDSFVVLSVEVTLW